MTIRWGILGCGDVVRKRVARAILDEPNSELVAACRRNQAKLDEFCSQFGVTRAYAHDADLLDDDEIDAVYIATPVNLHCPQTVAAASQGKHVLVEKPMGMSVAECDEMIAACREHQVKLAVAYYRRFYPVVERMKEIVAAGEIGRVLSVSAVTATALAMSPDDDGYWRVIPEQGGGGALMDIGSHRINLFLDMFGEAKSVKAICGTVAADYDADDCASLVFEFQSGVQGSLQCYFGAGADPDEFAIMGTKGRLVSRPLNGDELQIQIGQERRTESHPPAENFNAPLIADFAAAILDDRNPMVSGDEGRLTNVAIERAYRDAAPSATAP